MSCCEQAGAARRKSLVKALSFFFLVDEKLKLKFSSALLDESPSLAKLILSRRKIQFFFF